MSFTNLINRLNMQAEARNEMRRRLSQQSRFGQLHYQDNVERIEQWRNPIKPNRPDGQSTKQP